MKNKALTLGVVSGAFLLMPFLVSAEEVRIDTGVKAEVKASTTRPLKNILPGEKIRDLKAKIEDKREEMQDKMEQSSTTKIRAMATSSREKIEAGVKERFQKFIGQIIGRFDAAIDRFDKIVVRIESRIAKFESAGSDMSQSKALLADAKIKIEAAKESIAQIQVQADVAATGDLKTLYPAVREQFTQAKNDIKAVQQALIGVVKTLGSVKAGVMATSTATTSVSQ